MLDVNLPGLSGLDLQTAIAGERGDMPIIFVTGFGDIPMSVRAVKAGAVEFLTKPFGDQVLLDAIGAALERSRAAVGDQVTLQALRDSYADLSPRERQGHGRRGLGPYEQAGGRRPWHQRDHREEHRGRVMEKMHARSLAELVNMSASLGLSVR